MENKVKEEMERIYIPEELFVRSNLGVQKAMSEKKFPPFFYKKWTWIAAVLIIILITGVSNSSAIGYVKFHALPIYMKITKTKEGILFHKKVATAQLENLKKDLSQDDVIFVTITLNRPISIEEYKKLVEIHDIKVKMAIVRFVQKDGLKITGTIPGVISDEDLQRKFSDIESRLNSDFKGVIEIVGDVKVKNIDGLKQNPRIFLVDPSCDPHLVPNYRKDYMPGLFWSAEKNKLVTE